MAKEKNKTELPKVMEGELQARLIKLREDAGYDLSQMAAVLCLSEEVIVNLENEAFDLLPEPPYVRGYLRNYAKLGDDDPSELINRYEALRGADANELDFQIKSSGTIKTTSQSRISPIWAQVIMLAVLLGGIGFISTIPEVKTWFSEKWEGFSSQLEPSSAENNPSLLGDLPVPAPLPEDDAASLAETAINAETTSTNPTEPATSTTKNSTESTQNETSENTSSENVSTASTTSENNTTDPDANSTSSETTSETANTTDSATETTQETVSTNTTDAQTVSSDPNGLINLKLVFNKEVWLRIKDKDNKTVFEGLNKEGTEKAVDLAKPLTFRVGNAQGLSLFIDGKAVDISSYINGSIANFTLE